MLSEKVNCSILHFYTVTNIPEENRQVCQWVNYAIHNFGKLNALLCLLDVKIRLSY
jgi:hypothetical protein